MQGTTTTEGEGDRCDHKNFDYVKQKNQLLAAV